MELKHFIKTLAKHSAIDRTAAALELSEARIHWKGLIGSAKSLLSILVADQVPGIHLFVLADKEEAAYFLNDLEGLSPQDNRVLFFPSSYRVPYQLEQTDNANVVARAEVLEKISDKRSVWIVTYPEALFEKIPSKKNLVKHTMRLEVSKSYSTDFLNELLLEYQFERVDFVYEPGQFSIRGGILDVFSYANENPFRIEFFGDEIESIRTFDPSSQLSIVSHQFFNVIPNIQMGHSMDVQESLLGFVGIEATCWMADVERTYEILKREYERAVEIHSKHEGPVTYALPHEKFVSHLDFEKQLRAHRLIEFGPKYNFRATHAEEFDCLPQPSFNKDFERLDSDLKSRRAQGFENLVFSNQPRQIERLYQIFMDMGLEAEFTALPLALHEGFILPSVKLVCYTDHQLFERYHRFRLKEGFRQAKQALTIKEIYQLQKGDYVTHIDHGIGQFSGLETIDVNGKEQEAIRLVYKDGDVLYVGIHSLHRISKFTGKEGSAPTLNKLGTQSWSNLKNKTKKKIKELAFDLIKLYAQRRSKPGFSFSPDSYLQNELEASFMFEDTPDQFKATQDIKRDMESPRPMDRLICGDVGFGKTEVAIRAAFKAVADSKQVAVLVPTTILSLQHFRTFKNRLEGLPVTVEYINRFKSSKEITATLKRLAEGQIDILVGTHALVADRVKFKDLGLMIIDEEQKFGVAVKDKLKTLRTSVDTLTLTATPIPRTLQFSLMGARDLSIINTPPPNRQPVLTEIVSFNEELIRDAIAYEVGRGGQVFFVNNRLSNIRELSGMIQRLCPGVRVGIGHGQMDGKQLEKVMLDFIEGAYDVLLATTIIESGIDISNANTIIINDAHQFGLSDLHQLRGRVGRSNKKGFCYLIAPKFSIMTSEARKRLEALVQFSDLGSGFNIAMKDLDIRGAGNMLGGEQSGFIAEIGFEMYQKILNEAMQELKEAEFKDLFEQRHSDQLNGFVQDCIFETDLEVRIPDHYVNQVAERLSLYQALDDLKDKAALNTFSAELIDRFGPLPKEVKELLFSFELRWLAQSMGLERLVLKSEKLVGYFISNPQSPFYETQDFQNILNGILAQPNGYKLVQKGDKLRLVIEPIEHIKDAFEKLALLQQ